MFNYFKESSPGEGGGLALLGIDCVWGDHGNNGGIINFVGTKILEESGSKRKVQQNFPGSCRLAESYIVYDSNHPTACHSGHHHFLIVFPETPRSSHCRLRPKSRSN